MGTGADLRVRRGLRLERSPFAPAAVAQLAGMAVLLVAVGLVLAIPLTGAPPAFDAALVDAVRAPDDTRAFAVVRAIGRVGHLLVVAAIAVGVAAFAWWRSGRPDVALLLATVLGGATVVTGILKLLIDRARPDDALTLTAAFPSGHTVRGAAVLGLVGWIVRVWSTRRSVRALVVPVAVLLVLVNGAARVVLGVHWPTDVLAGFLLGGAWLAVSVAVLRPHVVPVVTDAPPDGRDGPT